MCPKIWETAVGLARNGGLAELVALRPQTLRRLPGQVSSRHGALIEPLAVALRAVRRSGISVGQSAAVFGGGPIGLLVVALLKLAGASQIQLIEPAEPRRKIAMDIGAQAALDPTSDVREHFLDPGPRPPSSRPSRSSDRGARLPLPA